MYKMAILLKIKSHSDDYFKELPFYNKPIERPIKRLKNIDPLFEPPFYGQLSIIKKIKLLKDMQCHIKLK